MNGVFKVTEFLVVFNSSFLVDYGQFGIGTGLVCDSADKTYRGLRKSELIFKGGTCLKKMHFEDYRYSEDIDFTLKDDSVSDKEILENFRIVFEQVYEESRIT